MKSWLVAFAAFIGFVVGTASAHVRDTAPSPTPVTACHDGVVLPLDLLGPAPGEHIGDDVHFVRNGKTARVVVIRTGLMDDSVSDVSRAYRLTWSGQRWEVSACEEELYRCARGMPWETATFHAAPCS